MWAKYLKIKKKNSRTRGSGNCRRAALTVGKQNFAEILRSPIPITVSRGERQDAVIRRFFMLLNIFIPHISRGG